MEEGFFEALGQTLHDFENSNDNNERFKDLSEESTSLIIKGLGVTFLLDSIHFEEDIKFLKKEIIFSIIFSNADIEEISTILKTKIESKKLSLDYTFNYVPLTAYKKHYQVYRQSDILVAYHYGIFSISFQNKSSYLFSEILYVIISSVIYIFMIILSGGLLIKKYLNEKKLTAFKNEFINNLTHELQTPVTISGLALEKLKIDLNNDSKLNKYVSIAQQENNKIGKLSKRILKLAELKTTVFKKDRVSIIESIEQVIKRYKLIINKEDVLLTDLNHLDLKLNADKEQFTDLVDNLLSNAIKYSKSPRSIVVKTSIKNKKLWLSVKDNGIGIPKEFRDKVFSPFFKVPNKNIHKIKSNGLGLSYVAEIVKRMGGTITISGEINKGTEFNIALPL